jgi:hypothetical protein
MSSRKVTVTDAAKLPSLLTEVDPPVPTSDGVWVDSDGARGLLWRVSVARDGTAWTWCADA